MLRLAIVAVLLAVSVPAQAQSPPEALGRCFADHTSGKDRKDLATWIFLAMAAHPEIKQHASATAPAAAEENARTVGALVTRLLVDACANETRTVITLGGAGGLQLAFQSLGQLAMLELMTDKSVTEAMGIFERYLDKKRLGELAAGK
jgi:hypothetical protein